MLYGKCQLIKHNPKDETMKRTWILVCILSISFAGCASKKTIKPAGQNLPEVINKSNLVNPFEVEGKWYRANLHTHTTLSDGDVNLPVRIKQYRDKGYNVLVITDHEKTNNIAGYSDANMLVINGMESHPVCPGAEIKYHFVCLNIPFGFHRDPNASAQQVVDSVKSAGGEIIVAHPYWCGYTPRELLAVDRYIGIEVYNGNFRYTGKGYSSVQWDQLSNTGKIIPAVANDDLHQSEMIGQSWTMIKAKQLNIDSIMDSLRKGCYYASNGPVIEDFRADANNAFVKCSPVVGIYFMGQNNLHHDITSDRDHLITSGSYKLPKNIRYVRAEVVDANGRHAWTNPIDIQKIKNAIKN